MVKRQVSDKLWPTTFSEIRPAAVKDGQLVVCVPNQHIKERLTSQFLPTITKALATVSKGNIRTLLINVEIQEDEEEEIGELNELGQAITNFTESQVKKEQDIAELEKKNILWEAFNEKFTFERFVSGPSNSFSYAAARRVAEEPGHAYNPLYIYGGTGLGKTHLLGSIGNYIRTHYPDKLIWLIPTETFMNEFVRAIRDKTLIEFKERYRHADVLLFDDVQFLAKKETLQGEFFHTFNALYDTDRQIVLTSDCPPSEIPTIEERLRSRFNMGLITDVQPPDLETRLAILQKKLPVSSERYINQDILAYIAEKITHNIRELEGALNRVCAYATLHSRPISEWEARDQLQDLFSAPRKHIIKPENILGECSPFYDIPIRDITGTSRRQPIVHARHVSMYIMRELTDLSFPAIAQVFGGRDHTTVIHAEKKIKAQMASDKDIYSEITKLIRTINNKHGMDHPGSSSMVA